MWANRAHFRALTVISAVKSQFNIHCNLNPYSALEWKKGGGKKSQKHKLTIKQ